MPLISFEPAGIQIECTLNESILNAAARAGVLIVAPCGGRGVCRKCSVLIDGKEKLACLNNTSHDMTVQTASTCLIGDRSEQVAVDFIQSILHRIPCNQGPYLALDLGTTGVAALWVDPATGETQRGKVRNRQSLYGADVLSRILMVEDEGEQAQSTMQLLARESVREAIAQLGKVKPAQSVVLSANPTMVYLLLGWDVSPLRQLPSPPMQLAPTSLPAHAVLGEIESISKNALLNILPGSANYLGGDVLAGLALIREFYPDDHRALLIDAGTNGEIVLAVEDAILAIATSAGPAFEGGEVSAGLPAVPGAIDRVRISNNDLWGEYSTISGLSPIGVCGSGIIELVAELDRVGALDRNGKIRPTISSDAIQQGINGNEYILVPAPATGNGKSIKITDSDLRAIINTKAAIFAGCRLLTNSMGLAFHDLDHIFVAGDFGYHLNIQAAIRIGMLPDIDPEKYVFLGNASLAGAMLSLILPHLAGNITHLAHQTTFLDLSTDSQFVAEFIAASFIPHTDISLFPSTIKE